MGVVKEVLLNFNSFQSPQFFRFNGEPEFTNYLGGIFTIFIRGILLALLIVKLISVFSYSSVYATSSIKYQINPAVKTVISPSDKNSPFIVAIEAVADRIPSNMTLANVSDNLVSWTVNSSGGSTLLQRCNYTHWQSVSPTFWAQIQKSIVNTSFIFCLPTSFQHIMDVTQESTLEIDFALRCRAECSTVSYIKMLVRPIIYNRLINPQQNIQYVTHFLSKRRYHGIESSQASFDTVLNHEISNYKIDTDESLMPWETVNEEEGIFLPNQAAISYRPNRWTSFIFVRLTFILSNSEYTYFRSFAKIFDAISLVGGLIPVFMIVFIWLYYYALAHFEMTFVKRLHSDQKAKEYGVFYFFSKLLYTVLSFFKVDMNRWEKTQEYHKMHKIVNNHLLDVIYLYKRIQFLERALEVLLEDHQKKVLHLMRNKTFNEAQKNYGLYQMKSNINKFSSRNHKNKKKKAAKVYKNEIILEPEPPVFHPIDSLNSDKNLVVMRDFQGDVRESPLRPAAEEPRTSQERTDKPMEEDDDDSEYNQQVEHEQIEELREAFTSFQKLRHEAMDSNSEYYNVISRNIYKRLDDVDRQLLENLQHFLNTEQKDAIFAKVFQHLNSKEYYNIEDSLFRRSRGNSRSNQMQEDNGMLKSSTSLKHMAASLQRRNRLASDKKKYGINPLSEKDEDKGSSND